MSGVLRASPWRVLGTIERGVWARVGKKRFARGGLRHGKMIHIRKGCLDLGSRGLAHLLRPAVIGVRRISGWSKVFRARGRKADSEEEKLDIDAGKFAFWNIGRRRPT